jgi:uncharacterized protein (DUF1330 family)
MMPAYCLLDNLEITDQEKLERYKARVSPIVKEFGGRYVVLGGKTGLVEETWKPTFPAMIESSDFAQVHVLNRSKEYRDLKALRLSANRFDAIIIEGLHELPEFVAGASEWTTTTKGKAP